MELCEEHRRPARYLPVEDEVKVIQLVRGEETEASAVDEAAETETERIAQEAVFEARRKIVAVHVSDAMERNMADLVYATRTPRDPPRRFQTKTRSFRQRGRVF